MVGPGGGGEGGTLGAALRARGHGEVHGGAGVASGPRAGDAGGTRGVALRARGHGKVHEEAGGCLLAVCG